MSGQAHTHTRHIWRVLVSGGAFYVTTYQRDPVQAMKLAMERIKDPVHFDRIEYKGSGPAE